MIKFHVKKIKFQNVLINICLNCPHIETDQFIFTLKNIFSFFIYFNVIIVCPIQVCT